MTLASPAVDLGSPGPHDHIVDTLIAERAPKLTGHALWPVVRPALYALLDYRKARRMADAMAPLPGPAAVEHVARLLDLKVAVRGLEHVPRTGRLIVVCNHPTGIADGLAVYDVLKTVRSDLIFYANADAHRVASRLNEMLIPVEWVEAKRTRERLKLTLQMTRDALEAERCLAIFPAGRISRAQSGGELADPTWASSAVSLARKYGASVVPIHVAGPWSMLFHLFHRMSQELRDITLFHELLNKQGRRFALTVGPALAPEALAGEAAEVTARLKAYVEGVLPKAGGAFA
jgi:putative hemolysin